LNPSNKNGLLDRLQQKIDKLIKSNLNFSQLNEIQQKFNTEFTKALDDLSKNVDIQSDYIKAHEERVRAILSNHEKILTSSIEEQNKRIAKFLAKFSIRNIAIVISGSLIALSGTLAAFKHVMGTIIDVFTKLTAG
jgi:vacuolar-type H+-ATPase subunit C/Vma6